jgi:hypothetical protein
MGVSESSLLGDLQELPIDQAINELRDMRREQQTFHKEVSRKRWRPSEKAMAMATYARRDSALLVAILALEKELEKT